VVKLTADERGELEQVVSQGKVAAWKAQRAQALLKCDQGAAGPGWADERLAEAFGCTTRSLGSWRKQAVMAGPLPLLERKPRRRPAVTPKLDAAAGGRHGRAAQAVDRRDAPAGPGRPGARCPPRL
jgi:hypothetical protein